MSSLGLTVASALKIGECEQNVTYCDARVAVLTSRP